MHSIPLFLLALSTLSSALPNKLARKDACTPKVSYTISRFTRFVPSSGNANPPSIFFLFSDDADSSVVATCSQSGPLDTAGDIACSNTNITASFIESNSTLTITETYTPCNSPETAQITGVFQVGQYCTPTEPPMPMGYGESCTVEPQGWFMGSWST